MVRIATDSSPSQVIETEFRGPLSQEVRTALIAHLSKIAQEKIKDRLSVLFFRDSIPRSATEILADPVDIRVRLTNGRPELIVKNGAWGASDTRVETSVPLTLQQFVPMVQVISNIGWRCAVAYPTYTQVFVVEGIEFAVVSRDDVSYFEAEILDPARTTSETARRLIASMRLPLFTEQDFGRLCDAVNNDPRYQLFFPKDYQKLQDQLGSYLARWPSK